MKTYQYTSPENTVVAVIDDDGLSRMSMLAELVPEDEPILPYVPPPTAIPQSVTMRQARLALLGAGLLSGVDAAIASLTSPQKEAAAIEWEYAQDVQRNNPLINAMASALGMTELQLDELFLNASIL